MRIVTTVLLTSILIVLPPSAKARTWYIKADGSGDAPSIQAGMDSASASDTVLVADGTYTGPDNKNLDFGANFPITVRSENGPDGCVIDCQGSGRAFYFLLTEMETCVVDGFTVKNGNALTCTATFGGGILCEGSSPTITNCRITANTAEAGGGIVCRVGSHPTIANCTIEGNTAELLNPDGVSAGGGICCMYWCYPTITNCVIAGNTARHANQACGGGVACRVGCAPRIINCTITANIAEKIAPDGSALGGGVHFWNNAWDDPEPVIANCVLWGDSTSGNEGQEIAVVVFDTQLVISYSDVEGGQLGVYTDDPFSVNWGAGNMEAAPLFHDPGTYDFHLGVASPCIDAGDDMAVPCDSPDLDGDGNTSERIPLDLDCKPRFVDPLPPGGAGVSDPPDYPEIVDMGAYESQSLEPVPGISEWGLIAVSLLLLIVAGVLIVGPGLTSRGRAWKTIRS